MRFSVSGNFPGNMTCCGDRNSRRLEFPIDFQPFQPFQMSFIRHQELKNLQDPLIFSFCASSFGGKSPNTKIASTECFLGRVWANFALAHQHVGEGKTERKCAVPLEILVESQGSPSGNRVVEINPSRGGNVRLAQRTSGLPSSDRRARAHHRRR